MSGYLVRLEHEATTSRNTARDAAGKAREAKEARERLTKAWDADIEARASDHEARRLEHNLQGAEFKRDVEEKLDPEKFSFAGVQGWLGFERDAQERSKELAGSKAKLERDWKEIERDAQRNNLVVLAAESRDEIVSNALTAEEVERRDAIRAELLAEKKRLAASEYGEKIKFKTGEDGWSSVEDGQKRNRLLEKAASEEGLTREEKRTLKWLNLRQELSELDAKDESTLSPEEIAKAKKLRKLMNEEEKETQKAAQEKAQADAYDKALKSTIGKLDPNLKKEIEDRRKSAEGGEEFPTLRSVLEALEAEGSMSAELVLQEVERQERAVERRQERVDRLRNGEVSVEASEQLLASTIAKSAIASASAELSQVANTIGTRASGPALAAKRAASRAAREAKRAWKAAKRYAQYGPDYPEPDDTPSPDGDAPEPPKPTPAERALELARKKQRVAELAFDYYTAEVKAAKQLAKYRDQPEKVVLVLSAQYEAAVAHVEYLEEKKKNGDASSEELEELEEAKNEAEEKGSATRGAFWTAFSVVPPTLTLEEATTWPLCSDVGLPIPPALEQCLPHCWFPDVCGSCDWVKGEGEGCESESEEVEEEPEEGMVSADGEGDPPKPVATTEEGGSGEEIEPVEVEDAPRQGGAKGRGPKSAVPDSGISLTPQEGPYWGGTTVGVDTGPLAPLSSLQEIEDAFDTDFRSDLRGILHGRDYVHASRDAAPENFLDEIEGISRGTYSPDTADRSVADYLRGLQWGSSSTSETVPSWLVDGTAPSLSDPAFGALMDAMNEQGGLGYQRLQDLYRGWSTSLAPLYELPEQLTYPGMDVRVQELLISYLLGDLDGTSLVSQALEIDPWFLQNVAAAERTRATEGVPSPVLNSSFGGVVTDLAVFHHRLSQLPPSRMSEPDRLYWQRIGADLYNWTGGRFGTRQWRRYAETMQYRTRARTEYPIFDGIVGLANGVVTDSTFGVAGHDVQHYEPAPYVWGSIFGQIAPALLPWGRLRQLGRRTVVGGAAFLSYRGGSVLESTASPLIRRVVRLPSAPPVVPWRPVRPSVGGAGTPLTRTARVGTAVPPQAPPITPVAGRRLAHVSKATPGAKGGTYVLRDPETGAVVRTGRTNDLARRQREHATDLSHRDYVFEAVHRTDVYAEQRGLEEMLNQHYNAPLDKIKAIGATNPRRQEYMKAARAFLEGR